MTPADRFVRQLAQVTRARGGSVLLSPLASILTRRQADPFEVLPGGLSPGSEDAIVGIRKANRRRRGAGAPAGTAMSGALGSAGLMGRLAKLR